MTKAQSLKKNLSSIQVLKTLQFLLNGNYSMNELITKLNENENFPIFNNSVISKYINTCRYLGFTIPKVNNRYYVTSIPFGLSFNTEESDLIENLQNTAKSNMSKNSLNIFDKFIEKVNRCTSKKISRIEKNDFDKTIQNFETAVNDKRKIRLIFKNQSVLEGIPVKIIDTNNKTYFVVFKNRNRAIDISRLSAIEILSDKFVHSYSDTTVVFELKDKLAKRYVIRENEHIINSTDGTLIVSNVGENKDLLFSRLLRYDDMCEIISPKIYRDEFRQIVDNTLANYGEV